MVKRKGVSTLELFTVAIMASSEATVRKLFSLIELELAAVHKQSGSVELAVRITDGISEIKGTGKPRSKDSLERNTLIIEKTGWAIAKFIHTEYETGMVRNLIAKLHHYTDASELAAIEQYCFSA